MIASFSSLRSSLIAGTRGHPPSSTDDLAGLLNCDKTNVTGLVGRVAKRDLVKRSIHLDGRRVTQVARTAQGEELAKRFQIELQGCLDERPRSLTRGLAPKAG